MNYSKIQLAVGGREFHSLISGADLFVCAAGFEARAKNVPLAAEVARNPVVVVFKNGPRENEQTYKLFERRFAKIEGFSACELDLTRVERFDNEFEAVLGSLVVREHGSIVIDVSGLPNFAICVVLAVTRQRFPMMRLIVLHTEAENYFPQLSDFEKIKRKMQKSEGNTFDFLSDKAVTMHMPNKFSGVTLGHNDTCLIVFAGYEPHRTACALEAMNPSKLVMAYGCPKREDLKWRLELSKIMHSGLDDQMTKTEVEVSTSDVTPNLELILDYYEHLYDDHCVCICPTNSKMQAVASFLAWETYPDIQLNFPIPADYLSKRFSLKSRDTFAIDLGVSPGARKFLGPL